MTTYSFLPNRNIQTGSNDNTGKDFAISRGHYYVHGILCENDAPLHYSSQKNLNWPDADTLDDGEYLAYLDVWERLVNTVEDDPAYPHEPSILEVALGGVDTALRAQVVWQVKTRKLQPQNQGMVGGNKGGRKRVARAAAPEDAIPLSDVPTWLDRLNGTGRLAARVNASAPSDSPCLTPPDSNYRGPENQLYRVEIHEDGASSAATFKWSRENGSVVFPIVSYSGNTYMLEHLGRDRRSSVQPGDWVEVMDDRVTMLGLARPLMKVLSIDPNAPSIILDGDPANDGIEINMLRHPFIRRWDQNPDESDESSPASKGQSFDEGVWIDLEDGVQIKFDDSDNDNLNRYYRTGDYWIIPARVATGDVEWPQNSGGPQLVDPHGIRHYYAPLGYVTINGSNVTVSETEIQTADGSLFYFRRQFRNLVDLSLPNK